MDRYWSYIGTPLFFAVIGFGIFTLFTVEDIQLISTKNAGKLVRQVDEARPKPTDDGVRAINVAASAKPATGAPAKPPK